MLENLLSGWEGKLLVLVLLGFAATDFVITMTLSAADAAQHAIENPYLYPLFGEHRMALDAVPPCTAGNGFPHRIQRSDRPGNNCVHSIFVVEPGSAGPLSDRGPLSSRSVSKLAGCSARPRGLDRGLRSASALIFPRLALGLSGFETGVSVMPLIAGKQRPDEAVPSSRILNTRKLLAAAALIMSCLLIVSSFVTAVLIPPSAYQAGG